MVEHRPIRRAIHLEFAFDRLLAAKLERLTTFWFPIVSGWSATQR
jgi:hypothetical protein